MQRSWERSVDRAVLICAGFLATVQLLATTGALGTGDDRTRVALIVLMGSQATFGILCFVGARLRSPARLTGPALLAALAGLGAVALAGAGELPDFATHTLPANAIQTLQLVAIGFLTRPILATGLVLATCPLAVLSLRPSGLSTWAAIDEWILPAASSIAIIVVVGVLRGGAAYADALIARNRFESAAATAAANADLAVEEAHRVLHDEVITALRGIELNVPTVTRDQACRSALTALSRTRGEDPGGHTRAFASLSTSTGVAVRVRDEGWPTAPPPRVVEAMRGAATEALRNVERHAQATGAELLLDGAADHVSVEIRDDGTGFDTGLHHGFGIRESIVGRMAAIGGAAEVTSSPTGTTVRLMWPRPAGHDADDTTPSPLQHSAPAYLWVGVAPAVANLLLAIRHPGDHPALALTIWLAVTALLVIVARRLSDGAPPLRFVALATLTTLGLLVAGLAVAGNGALLSLDSWVLGYCGIVLTILAFEAPVLWSLGTLIVNLLLVAGWAALDPTLRPLEPVGSLGTVVLVIGTGILLGAALRRSVRIISEAEADRAAQQEERAWRAQRRRAREVHLVHLDSDVVPFFEALLDSTADDPAPRAAVLSAQCRDQLYLTQPLPEHTRTAARDARYRGVTLTIRTSTGHGQVPTAGWRALDAILAAAGPSHTVTVVPSRGSTASVRIVIVPPIEVGALPGAQISTDPAQMVVVVSTDRPTALSPDGSVGWTP